VCSSDLPTTNTIAFNSNNGERVTLSNTQIFSTIPMSFVSGLLTNLSLRIGASNTGLYSAGANTLNVVTNGVSRMAISDTAITSTLPVIYPSGTLTNTAISLGGVNSGFYSSAASTVNLVISGVNRLGVNATNIIATIPIANKTLDFPISFDGVGGTWACQDALTLGSTRSLTLTNGTLNLKSGVTSTVGSFVTTGTTMKYLGSTTPGTQATISDTSGTDTVTYLTIQDSNATGGATWSALSATNVDAGNNTGWFFSIPPKQAFEYTVRLRSFTQHWRF
jgi:hypothetical protein